MAAGLQGLVEQMLQRLVELLIPLKLVELMLAAPFAAALVPASTLLAFLLRDRGGLSVYMLLVAAYAAASTLVQPTLAPAVYTTLVLLVALYEAKRGARGSALGLAVRETLVYALVFGTLAAAALGYLLVRGLLSGDRASTLTALMALAPTLFMAAAAPIAAS